MERRYAQERLGSSCRAGITGPAADRVRGLVVVIRVGRLSSTATAQAGTPTSAVDLPSPGTQVLIVQKSNLGWVLAKANGTVVYTYGADTKGGSPTCTGSCASTWSPVTGVPKAGPTDSLPKDLGTVAMANGGKQITYDGMPLYTLKGAGALTTKGNGRPVARHQADGDNVTGEENG